jgi:hypothetical protein
MTAKVAPARRRGKVLTFVKPKKGASYMTPETKLFMPPVYALLEGIGVPWRKIPEREFQLVVDIWRRDRISKGQWRQDWQPDGENFVLEYARNHRWNEFEVVAAMAEAEDTGKLSEAQWAAMTHEEWLEWEASTVI